MSAHLLEVSNSKILKCILLYNIVLYSNIISSKVSKSITKRYRTK